MHNKRQYGCPWHRLLNEITYETGNGKIYCSRIYTTTCIRSQPTITGNIRRYAHKRFAQEGKNAPGNEKLTMKTRGQRHEKKKRGWGSNAHNHRLLYDTTKRPLERTVIATCRTTCVAQALPWGTGAKIKRLQARVFQLARPAGREKVEENDCFYFSLAAPRSIQAQVQLPARAKSSKKRTKQCKTKAPFGDTRQLYSRLQQTAAPKLLSCDRPRPNESD